MGMEDGFCLLRRKAQIIFSCRTRKHSEWHTDILWCYLRVEDRRDKSGRVYSTFCRWPGVVVKGCIQIGGKHK